jgi:uncharacterized membrane protein
LFAGCGETAEGVDPGAKCTNVQAVSYEKFVQPFMSRYCLRCHSSDLPASKRNGAPLDHNFDTEQGILDEAQHVALTAAGGPDAINTTMPPSGAKPSDEERRKLGEWLACHADADAGNEE